jgi:hypothetical protein
MTSIDPTSSLLTQLRAQLGAMREVAADARLRLASQSADAGHRTPLPGEPGAAPEDLAEAISRRVAVIDRADPDRRRKAFAVFLESLLLEEWGAELINDPAFYQLVATVQDQMRERPELSELMDQAADRLLAAR